jgi:hypothetical protein
VALTDETDAGAQDAPPSDDSIRGSIERLIASGKELAEAELAWAKIKGRGIARIVRKGLLFLTIALACLIVGLALLLVASVVALAPITGLFAATLIVAAVALGGAALFGLLARNSFRALSEDEAP